MIEAPNLICAAELVSPNVSPATTPTRSSGHDFRQAPSAGPSSSASAGPSSSQQQHASSSTPQRPSPAPWSTHASRSIDGDIGLGVPDRDSPNPNPAPRALQHSNLAYGYARSDSSPNVMRAGQQSGASTHSPPRGSHETQEDKEQRRQRAWGRNLYGNAHVSGVRVPAPEGGLGIWFLFTVGSPPSCIPLNTLTLQGPVCKT